jgi:hypothetical protein
VTSVDAEGVKIGEERISAQTVLWAAGVAASPVVQSLGAPLDRAGRVLAQATLQVPGHPELLVVGDICALQQDGQWLPGVAQVAEWRSRRKERDSGDPGPAAFAIPLQGLRQHGDNRARIRGCGHRSARVVGSGGLAHLGADPHLLAHRLPQSRCRHVRVGVGIRNHAAPRATDYW